MTSVQVNPRSYKSVLEAQRSGQYKSRGEIMRAVVEAFHAPRRLRRDAQKSPETSEVESEIIEIPGENVSAGE